MKAHITLFCVSDVVCLVQTEFIVYMFTYLFYYYFLGRGSLSFCVIYNLVV